MQSKKNVVLVEKQIDSNGILMKKTQLELRNSVHSWLKSHDKQVSVVFAARFTLRHIPSFASLINEKLPVDTKTSSIILPCFRAAQATLIAGVWPTKALPIVSVSEAVAQAAALAAFHNINIAASVADAAYAASKTVSEVYALQSAVAAAGAISASNTKELETAFIYDRDWIAKNGSGSVSELATRPLWPDDKSYDSVDRNWQDLKHFLLNTNVNWQVWTSWYDSRLKGGRINQKNEFAKANIDNNLWKDGAEKVNSMIQMIYVQNGEEIPSSETPDVHFDADVKSSTQGSGSKRGPHGAGSGHALKESKKEANNNTISIAELEKLKTALSGLVAEEEFIEGQTNATPISLTNNQILTLQATVNSLIEYQKIPRWEAGVKGVIQSLIRILQEFDALIDQLAITGNKIAGFPRYLLKTTIDKMIKTLEAIRPTDKEK